MAPSGLYARLCHAFLVNVVIVTPWVIMMYRVSQKKYLPQKALNNILVYVKPFFAKFCPVILNLYPDIVSYLGSLR